jgi:PAS domain S-box-containing protein
VTWSSNIERIFGLAPGSFAGTYDSWWALLHPEDRERATRAIEAALAGASYHAELRFIRPDGSMGWQLTRGYLVRDEEGKPLLLRGMVFDNTEEVKAREHSEKLAEHLAASERFLRLITDSIPAMVGYVGTDGRYVFANQTYESWFGLKPEGVVGQHMRALLGEDNYAFMESFVERAMAGEAVHYAIEVKMLDGSTRHVQPSYVPDRDDEGRTRGFVVLALDITEQVAARKHAESLAESARAANRSKDEFLAMLGHELRNPMAPILTAIELIKLRDSQAFRQERQVIERQVRHMMRLLDDLLDVSRITRGKVSLEQRRVDLAQTMNTAIELASPLLDLHRHQLSFRMTPGLFVVGDETRLSQVFSNLLTNAAKYTPAGGQIVVGSERAGDQARVWVSDSGMGIRAEMLPRVFELFAQERQTIDRSEGGLGLGLAIVHSLVTMHGGTVVAESAGEGLGSTFTVTLPLPAEAELSDSIFPDVDTLTRSVPRRILVVDDNADAADLLAEALSCLGHQVTTALDGAQALRTLEEFSPDVCLLDIGLRSWTATSSRDRCARVGARTCGSSPSLVTARRKRGRPHGMPASIST